VSSDYFCDAVLCLLRRTTDVNLPALTRYLSAHFPLIPAEWHVPIVVSSFAAAQKVAATYAEAVLSGDDERTILAKKSMTRWMHGLSAVQPNHPKSATGDHDSGVISSGTDMYSPTTNFIVEHQLPVPRQYRYLQQQFEQDLIRAGDQVKESCPEKSTTETNILSTVAAEVMALMPAIEPCTSPENTVTRRLFEDEIATADASNEKLNSGHGNSVSTINSQAPEEVVDPTDCTFNSLLVH